MTPARISPSKPTGRDWFTDIGLLIAALAAIVSSGTSLAGLARLAGWPTWLAVMLPATVDVYAIIATRVWLSRRTTSDVVRRYAKKNALVAIAASIVGNAAYHALTAGALHLPRWVLVVVVSMVPPTVIAALAHMTALRTREQDARSAPAKKSARTEPAPTPPIEPRERTTERSARTTSRRSSGPAHQGDPSQFADAVAAYRASVQTGGPLSERKLADQFGQSRRWARKVMDAARPDDGDRSEVGADPVDRPYLAYTNAEASGGAR